MRRRTFLTCLWSIACASALLLACSSPPKSAGKPRRTVLMTSYDDARVGREASQQVEAAIGILDDPALNAYVSEIGRKLLRGLPTRAFEYRFSVVDQPEPNAFALPGGYVFVTRGLLVLTNSEDELANAIGHEIVHAAHRHAAAQEALASRTSPLAMPWVRAAHLAAYGRDMERDADRGGQLLAAAAGYDPMAMSTFLRNLAQLERLEAGRTRLPSFLDTHPGAPERAGANAARAREIRWKRDPALGDTRGSYLRRVDGLAVRQRPEAGVFEGSRFLHPDLDFQIRFPEGWQTSNTNRAVGAASPEGNAVVFLSAHPPAGDLRSAAEGFLEKARAEEELRIDLKQSEAVKIGQLDAWRMEVEGRSRSGPITAYLTFVPWHGITWRITGASPSPSAGSYLGRTLSTMRSFRPLTAEERDSILFERLRIATARAGEPLQALRERSGNAWDTGRTAVYNGLFADHRFQGGELVKIAVVERYVPKPGAAPVPAGPAPPR